MPVNTSIRLRKGLSSDWTTTNPILASGEPGYDITNNILKIGDGTKTWAQLSNHNHTSSNITDFNSSVSGLVNGIYAPLISPSLTGIPTAPTAAGGTNTNQIATTSFVRSEVSNLVASAPAALDTLNELAAALGNDANFSTTITNNLATKVSATGTINYLPKFSGSQTAVNSLVFDNGTNVGIGTNNPQAPLDLSFNSNTDTGIRITNTNTSGTAARSSIQLYNNAYNAGFTLGGQSYTNNNWLRANRAALYSSFIMDYITGQHCFWIGGGGAATTPSGSTQVILIDSNAMQMVNGYPIAGGSAASSYLSFRSTTGVGTSDYIRFGVGNNGGTEAMRITTNGNIGIGTASPAEKMTVYGDNSYLYLQTQNVAGSGGIKFGDASARMQIYREGTSHDLIFDSINGGISESLRINYNNGNVIVNETGADIDFRIEGDTDSNLFFVDASTDRIGIGTSSPTYKLQVNGNFGATTKSFRINHPSKEGYSLEYGSLESPYHGVRLTGRGKVIKGIGIVELPDYLRDLIHDDETLNIQITNYKHGKNIYVDSIDLPNNKFVVRADRAKTLGELQFFWTLTGTRKDVEQLVVEKED